MWIDYKTSKLSFKVGEFIILFSTNIKFETFNDPENYYGIIFYQDKERFEIIDSKVGIRLLINGVPGEARDLPFNRNTLHFLPDFIKVKDMDDFNIKRMGIG